VARVGDCLGPGTIAAAVYGGHRFARELGETPDDGVFFRRDVPAVSDDVAVSPR
jgi:dimethylamine/trimethylamine dehydrogenase